MIVSTQQYEDSEINEIVKIRALEEEVDTTPEALALLTKIGKEAGLRYACNLIITSALIAQKRKDQKVNIDDVERSYRLFYDSTRSVKFVSEFEKRFIGDEGAVTFAITNGDAMETS